MATRKVGRTTFRVRWLALDTPLSYRVRAFGLTFLTLALIVSAAVSTAAPDTILAAPPAQAGWTLVWSDEFNGPANTRPDPNTWGYELGYVRNNEAQYYTDRLENARIDGAGNLLIEARRENYNGFGYTSASLITKNKRTWQYGRFEMRAKIPMAWGTWPAWWALGANIDSVGWPRSGEIDMMEAYQGKLLYNVMDSNQSWAGSVTETAPAGFGNDFHTWVMEWDANQILLYRDGVLKVSYNVNNATVGSYNPFRQPWYLLANLAIGGNSGGNPAGTAFPQRYYIDYVRVYTRTTYYRLTARHSGKVADVQNPNTSDGAHVGQWGWNGGAWQQWQFQPTDSGYYRIVSRNSGKCLDVYGGPGATGDGAQIVQWACGSGTNQQWRMQDMGNGYVQLRARHSNKCLDVSGASTADGAKLIQWTCGGGYNQQWLRQ